MRLQVVFGLVCLVGISLAAYSANTDVLYNNFNTCQSRASSDRSCIQSVHDGLDKLSTNIQRLHDIRQMMDKINSGFNTFTVVVGIAKYAPGIGTAVNAMKVTINAMKPSFNTAHTRVKQIDDKVWPWKSKVDNGITVCDKTLTAYDRMITVCTNGMNSVGAARTCVNSMGSGTLRSNLQNYLESFGGALNSDFSKANTALGNAGSVCTTIKSVTDIALSWPDISAIYNPLSSFYNALKPVLDFFASLQAALNKKICIPDPFEWLAEQEIIEEAAEALNPGNWGWRRKRAVSYLDGVAMKSKRSIATITLDRRDANALIKMSKRGDLCFSVQDVLDAIDSMIGALVDLANKAISAVMSALPSFSIPGMPDFSKIFNINFGFNLPNLDFGLDFTFFDLFAYLNFDCSAQVKNVCAAVSGNVNVDCSISLYTYYDNYIQAWLSSRWGRRKRDVRSLTMSELMEEIKHLMEEKKLPVPMPEVHQLPVQQQNISQPVARMMSENIDLREELSGQQAGEVHFNLNVNPADVGYERHDNKELSQEEAEGLVANMTPEQLVLLRDALNRRAGYNPDESG